MVDRSPAGPSLVALRREIEQIDRAIVLLMAARIDAAGSAIRCRSRFDRRIANPEQEARVLARARGWGASLGLSDRITGPIFRMLIEEGKARYTEGLAPSTPENSLRALVKVRTRARATAASVSRGRLAAPG